MWFSMDAVAQKKLKFKINGWSHQVLDEYVFVHIMDYYTIIHYVASLLQRL